MFRKPHIPLLLVALLLGSATVHAQDDSQGKSGSAYSKIGIGVPVDPSSSSAYGMGLFGVSFIESQVPSLANPAQWGHTQYGIASGGFDVRSTFATDGITRNANTLLSATDFQLQLPMLQQKLGLSAAFYPSTRSTYRIIEDGQHIAGTGATADTVQYTSESNGSGGINNIELGLGWKFSEHLAVGYAAKLVFASVDNQFLTTFNTDDYQPVNYTLQTSGSAMGHRFGAYLTLPGLFGTEDQLTAGAALDLPVAINADRSQEESDLLESTLRRNTAAIGEGRIELPATLSGGLTYRLNPLLAFTAEGLYQNWGDADYSYNSRDRQTFTDRVKFGAGMRYHPFAEGSSGFLSVFKYRLGATYDSGHLTINGSDISTIMFHGGLGMSSVSSGSTIDLSFYYGLRGTDSGNLVKENFWGLRLSLNLAESMFTRRRLQ